jgi:hypothetical protein
MFEYLQPRDGPVIDGLEQYELVMAKGQPQYNPLRCLVGNTEHGERLSRWTLSPEQREAIAAGADIFLELATFNMPMQPIRMAVSDAPNPDFFRDGYNLTAGKDPLPKRRAP